MILGTLSITPEREAVLDFTYPIWEEATGMITLTVRGGEFYIFKPLHIYVWCCYISVWFVVALFVRSYEFSATFWGFLRSKSSFTRLDAALWYLYGAIWGQGTPEQVNCMWYHHFGSRDMCTGIIDTELICVWYICWQCYSPRFTMQRLIS